MIKTWMTPWLLMAVPFLGATLSLLLRTSLQRMKTSALLTTVASMLVVIGTPWALGDTLAGVPFLCLLPLTAFLSLLGQPLHRDNTSAWTTTLVLLGLGLGILTAQAPAHDVMLLVLPGLLCILLYRYQSGATPETWRGLSAYGLSMVSAALALVLPTPASTVALLVTCATLLPLLPVHSGFIATLTGLPGNLPAFLVFLLPTVGFHTLLTLLPNLTVTTLHTVAILALAGAVYGSLRALIQARPLPRLSYAAVAFFGLLWWYVADTGTAPMQATVYLSAVGLAASGLLLAWYAIRARYGDIDLRALGGLAYPMPRFSTLLALLALAALGMPPFGVFSGFLGMLLLPTFTPSGPFAVVMIVWLTASWYYTDFVQQLIFGRQRMDMRYDDLRQTEFASLVLLLLLLLALGTAPSRFFRLVHTDTPGHCRHAGGDMDPVIRADDPADLEARRMELRGTIRLASEVIAQYWPMRTFVHHNPLHSLEYLPFTETVRRGHQFLGGNGYLPGNVYRRYLKSGRILVRHIDEALAPLALEQEVDLGPCRIAHREVLRACLTHGLSTTTDEPLDRLMEREPNEEQVEALAERLGSFSTPTVAERMAATVRADSDALGHHLTLSNWCDQTLGTRIVELINSELIKWCEAFLDEGHATWPMPGRDQGLYAAWKQVAGKEWTTCGIADSRRKIAALPEHPEDAVLDCLDALAIPVTFRQDYLSLQLAALPGWAGFIKWRAEETGYAWQQAYPVGLVKFLAVRLWYVRELVQKVCREELGIDGNYPAVMAYMAQQSHAYFMHKEWAAGRLPASMADRVARLHADTRHRQQDTPALAPEWEPLTHHDQIEFGPRRERAAQRLMARRLLTLAQALEIVPALLMDGPLTALRTLLDWIDAFPESAHGPVWLKAFEAGYQDHLFGMLLRAPVKPQPVSAEHHPPVRPHSQSVFCIDVRSEPFRRHLESTGANDTYGFAGFFAVFIRYRAWGKEHETEQFPVIMRAKNEVREIPRSYLDHYVSKHQSRAKLVHAGHTLLHDLKENVVTPYVMVESLGWFYALPMMGKTMWPALYKRLTNWVRRLFVPPIATILTVDKLAPAETEEMMVSEQRALIWKALRDRLGLHGSQVDAEFVEALRRRALDDDAPVEPFLSDAAKSVDLSADQLTTFLEELQRHYRINRRAASRQKERITRTGFTLEEQVLTVETALRMMGLVRNFARLVLFCAHGSTTENNPFESALDCGACGGNEGKPNARVLAAMANRPPVRERLAKRGIEIPSDTHFLAGQVDTTTDEVHLFDLEDAPPTHRKDVARLYDDLREAAQLTSQERCSRFPDVRTVLPLNQASAHVAGRSADWSQVRPEWGLSGNTTFIIGRRELTKGLNLAGRVFLHSYDYREDPTDRWLEVLLTAPQVVAQWINMEHYFSAVDNDVYGSGSKIYHNVVGRIGIMSGPWSDLRLGLAWQTVMNDDLPYHEPMRLLTLVEASRPRIEKLIARHEVLQHFYHNEWVHLAALDPEDGIWYRYMPSGVWRRVRNPSDT